MSLIDRMGAWAVRPETVQPPRARRRIAVAAGAVLLLSCGLALAGSVKRGLLWHVVRACATNKSITGSPFPCIDVDLSRGADAGFVVLKAPLDPDHDLVAVPTMQISGVESPVLREPGTPNYFADAWAARRFVDAIVPGLRREDIGLAVNSLPGRTQDQLHVHVDCLHAEVRDTLKAHAASFSTKAFEPLPFNIAGERYWGWRLDGANLDGTNIFKRVFDDLNVREDQSTKVTIAVAGATFEKDRPGFYVLAAIAGRAHRNQGHSEFLLNHRCRAD